MLKDKTSKIEMKILTEQKPKFSHVIKLFRFTFSTTRLISIIYLGLFILLSLLRPILAFIWGKYIEVTQVISHNKSILPAVGLLLAYFIINFLVELIDRYVGVYDRIEMLNIVQANHQSELMRSKMFEKYASISPEYYEVPKINDIMDQVFRFVSDQWGGLNTKVMMNGYIVIAKAISVISIAISLYIFNPLLCIVVLIAPIPTIWSLTIGQKMQFKFIKDNIKLERKAAYFQDLMLSSAAKELKILGNYDFFYQKWKNTVDEYTLNEKKVIRYYSILQIINALLVSIAIVSGSVLAIILMAKGDISLGLLGAVLTLISTLVNDVKSLVSGFTTIYMKKNESAQFFDFMELREQKNEGIKLENFNTIDVKNLKYRYPLTEKYILNDINISIRKGEKIALVGENGAGKTTFIKLLTGVLSPSAGTILINNVPTEKLNPLHWYDCISTVMQDPMRYTTFSIADNVFIGDTQVNRDVKKIEDSLFFSGLNELDKDTLLGKDVGGTDLSGGQWQKLAISRAAYRNRNIIVLDEPTSNLDPIAESDIFKKYIELSEDKTVFFVTHRISVASLADRIIVFSNGKIVQDGTHANLIKEDGLYSSLYNEQAKWYNR